MRYATVAIAASALLLAGCGSSDENSSTSPSSSGQSAGDLNASISAAASNLPGDATDADVRAAGFAVAFRAGFADLASGRSDEDVKTVYTGTCADIKAGQSEADVRKLLTQRLTNGATTPTDDQVSAIYMSIKVIC